MSRKALIVIDMLLDFIEEDGALYCGETSRAIIPFIQEKIKEVRAAGGVVIFMADNHDEDDAEFKMFPKHAVKGTPGSQVIEDLPMEPGDHLVPKTRFSGFYNTNLDEILKEYDVDSVQVVGVCTSICVMDTVGDLRNRDYDVTVHRSGVADFDQEAHEFALKRMENTYGAKVV